MPLFGPPNIEKMKAKGDVKGLIKAFGYEKDWEISGDAAKALGEIGDTRAVEPLIAALKDRSVNRRLSAAEALGKIGDTRALAPLIVALDDDNYQVREHAEKALIMIGSVDVESLIVALKSSSKYFYHAKVLGKIGSPAVEPLIALLKDSNDRRHPCCGATH
jgi:HEAT repeat protein